MKQDICFVKAMGLFEFNFTRFRGVNSGVLFENLRLRLILPKQSYYITLPETLFLLLGKEYGFRVFENEHLEKN